MDKVTTPNQFGSSADGFMSEGLTIETNLSDESMALTEGKDVEQESLEYQGLVSYVQERFQRSKDKRFVDEQRWLRAYKNFRGIYDQDGQFTSTERSKAFIKITKTKVLAAHAQVIDILLSGNKFPVGVEPSPIPEGILESVHIDPKDAAGGAPPAQGGPAVPSTISRPDILKDLGVELKEKLGQFKDKLKAGAGTTPTALTWEPAKEAAKKMDKKMQDQFAEGNASKHLRSMAFEMALFGHGVFKGPFAKSKEYPKWSTDGNYEPVIKSVADFDFVSIWDSYPDSDAINMDDAEDFIQRHRMSKSQLRALKKRPFFRSESIELAIKGGFNYQPEYWENTLKDYENKNGNERFEVLEFWGTMDKEFVENVDIKIPEKFDKRDQVQVNIWVCNGYILRVVFNPFTPARIPYHACPYELNPYSFFGIGIAENMEDSQLLMNGFIRMAVDNAVLSSNVIFEINETNLVPGQDFKIWPGKVFRTNGQIGQSIHTLDFKSTMQECLAMFDKARQLADESTGMPSYAHGQGGIQGIGRTASGMSMLMGAAKENIKAVVRNIDDYLLVPLGKSLFAFNMQFDFDKDFIGDLEVVARGTESLMRDEVRSQKILQFLQVTNNPMDAPYAKRDYLLRELSESLDLESDKTVNDPRAAGLQALAIQEMMKAQGIDPNSQGGGGGNAPAPQGGDPSSANNPGAAPEPGAQGFSGNNGKTPSSPNPKGT